MTLELRAFVWSFLVPQNPIGSRILAEVPPGSACVILPTTMSLTVIGPDLTGKIDTTVYSWTPSDPGGIYLVGVDSTALHGGATQAQNDSINAAIFPYDGNGPSIGETVTFVPGEAPGWHATFPSAPPGNGAILKTDRCDP
jgi:hypothetical protein